MKEKLKQDFSNVFYRRVMRNEVDQFRKRYAMYCKYQNYMLKEPLIVHGSHMNIKMYEKYLHILCSMFIGVYSLYLNQNSERLLLRLKRQKTSRSPSSNASTRRIYHPHWDGLLRGTNFENGIGIDPRTFVDWKPLLDGFEKCQTKSDYLNAHMDGIIGLYEYIFVDIHGSPQVYELCGKSPNGAGFLREYTDSCV